MLCYVMLCYIQLHRKVVPDLKLYGTVYDVGSRTLGLDLNDRGTWRYGGGLQLSGLHWIGLEKIPVVLLLLRRGKIDLGI